MAPVMARVMTHHPGVQEAGRGNQGQWEPPSQACHRHGKTGDSVVCIPQGLISYPGVPAGQDQGGVPQLHRQAHPPRQAAVQRPAGAPAPHHGGQGY